MLKNVTFAYNTLLLSYIIIMVFNETYAESMYTSSYPVHASSPEESFLQKWCDSARVGVRQCDNRFYMSVAQKTRIVIEFNCSQFVEANQYLFCFNDECVLSKSKWFCEATTSG